MTEKNYEKPEKPGKPRSIIPDESVSQLTYDRELMKVLYDINCRLYRIEKKLEKD